MSSKLQPTASASECARRSCRGHVFTDRRPIRINAVGASLSDEWGTVVQHGTRCTALHMRHRTSSFRRLPRAVPQPPWLPRKESSLNLVARIKAVLLIVAASATGGLAQSPPAADPASDNVGATFGQFDVSQTGAATYTIPIFTPAGRAGVKPEIAISYSSQGTYGPLGVGWSIGGQSSISRCRQTREHGDFRDANGEPVDGRPVAISFGASDRYCLDGQRLLLVAQGCPTGDGNFRDGDDGAEYRLESDPWTRVRSSGGSACGAKSAAGNPGYWTVERRDGTVAYYGNTTDSRMAVNYVGETLPSAPNASWSLNRTIDSKGNYIDYTYVQNPAVALGEILLSQVKWTGYAGSEGPALAPFATISFVYQPRPREQWIVGYTSGHQMVASQELQRIDVTNTGDTGPEVDVRSYFPTYETVGMGDLPVGQKRRLIEIRECSDRTAAQCYGRTRVINGQTRVAGTEFQYTPHAENWGSVEDSHSEVGSSATLADKKGQRIGDVTGDGRPDMVWYRNSGFPSVSVVHVAQTKIVGGALTLETQTSQALSLAVSLTKSDGTDGEAWALMDVDGDGKDDLIAPNGNTTNPSWIAYTTSSATGGAYFGTVAVNLGVPYVPCTPSCSSPPALKLADMDGDGLQDLVTLGLVDGQTRLVAHRFKRLGTTSSFSFGPAYRISFQFLSDDLAVGATQVFQDNPSVLYSCRDVTLAGFADGPKSAQPTDINGDGRADLFATVAITFGNDLQRSSCVTFQRSSPPLVDAPTGGPPPAGFIRQFRYLFTNEGIDESTQTITIRQYWSAQRKEPQGYEPLTVYGAGGNFTMDLVGDRLDTADINGDGLADLVYPEAVPITTQTSLRIKLNPGLKPELFYCAGCEERPEYRDTTEVWISGQLSIPPSPNNHHFQLADVNSDGRTEIVVPTGLTSTSSFNAHYWAPSNAQAPSAIGIGQFTVNALPQGATYGDPADQPAHFLTDFDGDGRTDFVRVRKSSSSSNVRVLRAAVATRHTPIDHLRTIINEFGARTQIHHLPLTNAAVYRPDASSRAMLQWGRLSPVIDVLAAMYVVADVSSSSPTDDSASAMSKLAYRYAGAKLQGGGRGILGFREVVTFDQNAPGQDVVTVGTYRQEFPFIGQPLATEKRVLPRQDLGACRDLPESQSTCFYAGVPFPALTGTRISRSENQTRFQTQSSDNSGLGFITFAANSSPEPIFVYVAESLEETFDLAKEQLVTSKLTRFEYGDRFGNATKTILSVSNESLATRANNGSGTLPNATTTVNVFDNPFGASTGTWRIGRLRESTTTQVRDGLPPSSTTPTLKSRYVYALAPPDTSGLLLMEEGAYKVDGTMPFSKTLNIHDRFGNVVEKVTCSNDLTEAECSDTTSIVFSQGSDTKPTTRVHRFARTEYLTSGANEGRYASRTSAPFKGPTAAAVVRTTLSVTSRDKFGEVTEATDQNGVQTRAARGAFGREYWAWSEIGTSNTVTYRWCAGQSTTNTVSCPDRAVYRKQVVVDGGARSWTYHDVLGREILKVAESFNTGDLGISNLNKDLVAACVGFDAHGRQRRATAPFFMLGNVEPTGPSFTGQQSLCAASSASLPGGLQGMVHNTVTSFDILGRTSSVTEPGVGTTTFTYNQLTTTKKPPCNNGQSVCPERVWTEVKNIFGEVASVTDPQGLQIDHDYDSAGRLRKVRRKAHSSAAEIVSEVIYDELGRKQSQIDPDLGTLTFAYNAVGEQIEQIDGNGNRVVQHWDAQGRVWQRQALQVGAETIVDDFTYDAANAIGLLKSQVRTQIGQANFAETFQHDTKGRVVLKATLVDGQTYVEETLYGQYGRVYRTSDATGGAVSHQYNGRGYLQQLCLQTGLNSREAECSQGIPLTVVEQNARGQTVLERRHDPVTGASVTRSYDPANARLMETEARQGAQTFQDLEFGYDAVGNLKSRQETRDTNLWREEFGYDALDRLTSSTLVTNNSTPTNQSTMALQYDRLGNICQKSLLGIPNNYAYVGAAGCGTEGLPGQSGTGAARAHAVQNAFGASFQYDVAGNQTVADALASGADRVVGYDALQQAIRMTLGQLTGGVIASPIAQTEFRYAAAGQRYKRVDCVGACFSSSNIETTHYVGTVERVIKNGSWIKTRRYVAGVLLIEMVPAGQKLHYLYTDHLGSIDTIADETGNVVERLSFNAHGQRRQSAQWSDLLASYAPGSTTRGFTGHEHVDSMNVIHMNGRIYDPRLGRFMQADVLIEADATQGLNRYTYVLNNPLTHTDPSGHSIGDYWRQIAAIVITIYAPYLAGQVWGALSATASFWVSVGTGFAAGTVASGDLKGGLWGAFSAGLFAGVGSTLPGGGGGGVLNSGLEVGDFATKVALHGIAGGIVQKLQGGKFGHGFLSAGATQAFSGAISAVDSTNPGVSPARVAVAAVVGGSVSAASGGKFANGAVTAAFAAAFGQGAHGAYKKGGSGASGTAARRGLTEGEVRLVQDYYGEDVPYEDIRVALKRPILAKGTIARTIGSKITYFDAGYYSSDFSTASPQVQAAFLHEVMHVWQNVNIPSYTAAAAAAEHIRFENPYAYTFDGSRALTSYRYEQQGQIMEDFAFARMRGAGAIGGVPIQSYERMIYGSVSNIYRSP